MRMAASVCQLRAESSLPRGALILRSLSSRGLAVVMGCLALFDAQLVYTTLGPPSRRHRPSAKSLTAGQTVAPAGMKKAGSRDDRALAPGTSRQQKAGFAGRDGEQLLLAPVRQDGLDRMLDRIGHTQTHQIFIGRGAGEILPQVVRRKGGTHVAVFDLY